MSREIRLTKYDSLVDWYGLHIVIALFSAFGITRGYANEVRIKEGKVWIQWDGTEERVADDLMALGVPREDIVLGFHPPHLRKFTEFAVS